MLSLTNRNLLFTFGCVGTRILFIIIAKYVNINYLPILGYLSLIPAIGFAYIYITDSRKTGYEAGGKIWWNYLRPIHSFLYFLIAYNAIIKHQENTWKILTADLIIGIIAFIHNRNT